MKKLSISIFIAMLMGISTMAVANKPADPGHAGPVPTVIVDTDCRRKSDAEWVNKFHAEVPPKDKNASLVLAIGTADFQIDDANTGGNKDLCVVRRTTPGGTVHEVYVVEDL